jgi:hypothetical protein
MSFTKPALKDWMDKHAITLSNFDKSTKAKLYKSIVTLWVDLQARPTTKSNAPTKTTKTVQQIEAGIKMHAERLRASGSASSSWNIAASGAVDQDSGQIQLVVLAVALYPPGRRQHWRGR